MRTEPGAARDFFGEIFGEIDLQIDSLAVKWHRFDLEKIDQATDEVLVRLEAKRDEIRARAGVEKEPETDVPR